MGISKAHSTYIVSARGAKLITADCNLNSPAAVIEGIKNDGNEKDNIHPQHPDISVEY